MGILGDIIGQQVNAATQPMWQAPPVMMGQPQGNGAPAPPNPATSPAPSAPAPTPAPALPPAPVPDESLPTPQSMGMVAPGAPTGHGIMSVIKNFITENPNTIAGNIAAHGLLGAGRAMAMRPYAVHEAQLADAQALASLGKTRAEGTELLSRGQSEQATAGETAAKIPGEQASSKMLEAKAADLGNYYEDKDGNIRGPGGNLVSVKPSLYSEAKETFLSALADNAKARADLAVAQAKGDKAGMSDAAERAYESRRRMDFASQPFRGFGDTGLGQEDQAPNLYAKLGAMLEGRKISAAASRARGSGTNKNAKTLDIPDFNPSQGQ